MVVALAIICPPLLRGAKVMAMHATLDRQKVAAPPADTSRKATPRPQSGPSHRYESPEMERIAKRVMQKHEVALRALAK